MASIVIDLPLVLSSQLPGTDLTPEDADRLASLGVDPATAEAAGLRRVASAFAARVLRRVDRGELSGILIPYVDPREPVIVHHRLWLDEPLCAGGDLTATQFLQPTGSTNSAYFIPGTTFDNLADIELPILLCTAEFDAMAALELDRQLLPLLPIGLGGPWGWRATAKTIDAETGLSKTLRGPTEEFSRISLKRRKVIIAYPSDTVITPDSFKARQALIRYLKKQGARPTVLDVPPGKDGRPRGLGQWIASDGVSLVASALSPSANTSGPRSGMGYEVTDEGIFWNDPEKPRQFLSSPFSVVACTRELGGTNWGRKLEFHDPDGNRREIIISMADLAGDCSAVAGILLSHGIRVSPNRTAKERLAMYIQREPHERVFVTSRVGWHVGSFVLPERTFAPPDAEPIIYQAGFGTAHNYKVRGTLDEWRENVGRRCAGNSRLVFSVSLAFVGPLLQLVDQDSGGFHLRGLSSTGKTTALVVAGSVWGGGRKGFGQSWRATSNGLEAVAELHNDSFLSLDELGQVAPEEAGRVAYMLGNGQGKVRMTKDIRVRPQMEWRLAFLSTGEIGLADHMQTIRRQVHGGQEVRLIDVAVDAGKGMGIFENLAGAPSPDSFANELSSAALSCYGSPIAAFLEHLVINREQAAQAANGFIQKFLGIHLPSGACGEVSRAARRFALVAFAGEYAASIGITGWGDGEATRASVTCFQSWLERRGTLGAGDIESAVSQVRNFITLNGSSRFETIRHDSDNGSWVGDANIYNRVGFREEVPDADGPSEDPSATRYVYYLLSEAFRREVCRGFDPEMVARALRDRGHLECENGRLNRQKRLPGVGKVRVYHILPSILEVAD